MEELRSTEILDKEIQEDARKKADKIVKASLEEADKILNSVKDRIESVRLEKQKIYEEKIARFEKDSSASLPLEKQRFLVSFESESVVSAIKDYLNKLSIDKKSLLLKKRLEKYSSVLGDKKVNIFAVDFDESEAKKIAVGVLGKDKILSSAQIPEYEKQILLADNKDFLQGFIVSAEDESVVCRVTLAEIVNEIKDNYSYELTETLFGGRLPQ